MLRGLLGGYWKSSMVYLFENEKILQQAEFKRITTVSYANEQDETSSGYQSGGTGCQSLVLTNY